MVYTPRYSRSTSTVGVKHQSINLSILWLKSSIVLIYDNNHMDMRVGIQLIGLTQSHFCACPKLEPGFPTSYVVVFIMFNELR